VRELTGNSKQDEQFGLPAQMVVLYELPGSDNLEPFLAVAGA
jgi:hypothetical protein